MDALAAATAAASSAPINSVQGSAALMVMKKAADMHSAAALQLIAALPQLAQPAQPALATSGTLGTRVNAMA